MKKPQLTLTKYRIPADIEGDVHFAFVSDLHGFDNDPIIELLQEMKPDAVLVGGDFVQDEENYEEGFSFLARSAQLFPTFCSIGNHDLRFPGDLVAAIQETGAVVLDNAEVSYQGVWVGGLSSALHEQGLIRRHMQEQIPDMAWLESFSARPGFKLLLCHHPEYYARYVRCFPVDLVLAGHAHGGQWCFFNRGVYAPGQGLFPKYTAGLYENRLLVSRGIGNAVFVPRIHNPAEILSIYLESNRGVERMETREKRAR